MEVVKTYGHNGSNIVTTVLDDDTIINHKNVVEYRKWIIDNGLRIHPAFDKKG